MYLIDTNIFLEVLLKQTRINKVKEFLNKETANNISVTGFSIHSIGIALLRKNLGNVFIDFLNDLIANDTNIIELNIYKLADVKHSAEKFSLDFDDAYQYTAAKEYNLQLVSFDKDFDKTDLKRIEP